MSPVFDRRTPRAVLATTVECLCGYQGPHFSASSQILSRFSSLTGAPVNDELSLSTSPTPPPFVYHSERSVTVFTISISRARYASDFSSCANRLAKCNNIFLAQLGVTATNGRLQFFIYIITPVHVESYVNAPAFAWFQRADIWFQIIWEKLLATDTISEGKFLANLYPIQAAMEISQFSFLFAVAEIFHDVNSKIFQFDLLVKRTFSFRSSQLLSYRPRKSEYIHRL